MGREVNRVVTIGTVTDEAMLPSRSNNYLASLHLEDEGRASVAWLDLSTGAFFTLSSTFEKAFAELARHPPVELLVPRQSGEVKVEEMKAVDADDLEEMYTLLGGPVEAYHLGGPRIARPLPSYLSALRGLRSALPDVIVSTVDEALYSASGAQQILSKAIGASQGGPSSLPPAVVE